MSEFIVVKQLTSSLMDDWLLFFDKIAFADNPDWSDCYCSLYQFANRSKDESRRMASNQIQDGRIHGFLAYENVKPVGWCNAANRNHYPILHHLQGPGPDKYEKVGSIVCFVVAASHRGQGVASKLLNAACSKFNQDSLEYAEGYPVKDPPSTAWDFPGPIGMYLKNGFTTYRDAGWYSVVRKRLQPQC